MKKLLALSLAFCMLLAAGCGVQTRDSATQPTADGETGSTGQDDASNPSLANRDPVALTLIATSSDETVANVVRDQLKRAGFDVTVNIYPDSGTYNAAVDTEQYDLRIGSYSGAGSPDANVRGPYHSSGAWNTGGYDDPVLDQYIDDAARLVGDQALEVYKKLERYLVEEMAYQVPLYSELKTYAVNKDVVDSQTIEASVGGARWVWSTDYIDASLRETRPYVMGINWANPNSFDCVQGRDGTTYYQRTNINVPLIQCGMGGVTQTRGSLTKQYTIGEDGTDFYFLLRTDINFGTYRGGAAVDTGLPVAAEDVKFTYDRAMEDKVPGAVGKSYLSSVEEVTIVTELETLQSALSADGGSVFDALNRGIDKPFYNSCPGQIPG